MKQKNSKWSFDLRKPYTLIEEIDNQVKLEEIDNQVKLEEIDNQIRIMKPNNTISSRDFFWCIS
jgi:hypothetical protein